MSSFKEGYTQTIKNIGGVSGTFQGDEFVTSVELAIKNAIFALEQEAVKRQNVSADFLKGWLAEQWHAETFKINGQAKDENNIWADIPGKNRTGEDIIYGNDDITKIAEVKYYKTGLDSAKAISRSEYTDKNKIIPSDQINDIQDTAQRLSDKNNINNPELASNYQDTATNSNDHIVIDNISSKPLDEIISMEMANDFKNNSKIDANKYGLKTEEFVEWSDIYRESGEAALNAAALSAALSAAPHVWTILKEYIEDGEIKSENITKKGVSILHGTLGAGLRGAIAASLTVTCKTGQMGDSIKSISPIAIGMATTMTINAINYSIQLQQGRISKQEFSHNCLRDSFVLATGMIGASIGQIIIPIPMLGSLVGNIVGSSLGAITFQGVNQVILGICIESGWTFFGTVKQNYLVSSTVLSNAGYDLIDINSFSIESFSINSFSIQTFNVNSLSFTPIRRGVISCNIIGNI